MDEIVRDLTLFLGAVWISLAIIAVVLCGIYEFYRRRKGDRS